MKSENDERRSAPRVSAHLHLHLVYEDLDELVESYSRDISEGGIYVKTENPLPIGSKVQLKISIVHQELMYIDALCEVVHADEKNGADPSRGMGVRFIEISPEGQQFIREFVLSRVEDKAPSVGAGLKPAPTKKHVVKKSTKKSAPKKK